MQQNFVVGNVNYGAIKRFSTTQYDEDLMEVRGSERYKATICDEEVFRR